MSIIFYEVPKNEHIDTVNALRVFETKYYIGQITLTNYILKIQFENIYNKSFIKNQNGNSVLNAKSMK